MRDIENPLSFKVPDYSEVLNISTKRKSQVFLKNTLDVEKRPNYNCMDESSR